MYEEARESGGPGSQEGGGASGRGGEGVRGTDPFKLNLFDIFGNSKVFHTVLI